MQETFQREQEHKQKVLDRRRRRGEIIEGEQLTHAEKNARMMAFLCVTSLLVWSLILTISPEHTSPRTRIWRMMTTKRRMRKMKTAVLHGLMKTTKTTVSKDKILSSQTTTIYLPSSASTRHESPGPFPEKNRL